MNAAAALSVFFGAGLGGLARYAMGVFLTQPAFLPFPLSTFLVNGLGALLAGVLFALLGPEWLKSQTVGLFLMTGFLGGLTTFSAFTAESFVLLCDRPLWALVHGFSHLAVCLFAFALAYKLLT